MTAVGHLPPPLVIASAAEQVRAANRQMGRRVAVVDDDPTGSQAVHDVDTVLDPADLDEIEAALDPGGAVCFILTNTRSLASAEAVEVNERLGRHFAQLDLAAGRATTVISRSDSTLRGHVVDETAALDRARREVSGRGYDGILLCPAFIEAGRITVGDVHLARVGAEYLPVAETEYARDPAFGYLNSDLRAFLEERSGGSVRAADVVSIGLDDIRLGGPDRVAQLLARADGSRFFVVNAIDNADLDVVALGVVAAQRTGLELLLRTGPSMVRAVSGLAVSPPLSGDDIFFGDRPSGFGVLFVGSHVGTTSRQLAKVFERGLAEPIELDVLQVLDPDRRAGHIAAVAAHAVAQLAKSNVAVFTSRAVVARPAEAAGLDIARQISAALSAVAMQVRTARPAWVIGKGGITSHDIAISGLGIRRARVLGQLLPGLISVLRPLNAPDEVVGMPYVVFAGNVGVEQTLADVVGILDEPR